MLTKTKQSDIDYLINNPNEYIVDVLGKNSIKDFIEKIKILNDCKAFTWSKDGKIISIIFRAVINNEYFISMICTKHLKNNLKSFFNTATYVLEKWQKQYIIKAISSTSINECKFHKLMGFKKIQVKEGMLIWKKTLKG